MSYALAGRELPRSGLVRFQNNLTWRSTDFHLFHIRKEHILPERGYLLMLQSSARRPMPGGPPTPTRPRQLISFSPERVRYSSGGGVFGLIFGFIFSSVGAFLLVMGAWLFLACVGVPLPQQTSIQPSIFEILCPALMFTTVGGVFSIAGYGYLWTLRACLDRQRDEVIVRSGWLGCRRHSGRLSEFRQVVLLPAHNESRREEDCTKNFDVALSDDGGRILVVGYVTLSVDLAQQFAREVSEFTHLPIQ
jgi:hypothetical protein